MILNEEQFNPHCSLSPQKQEISIKITPKISDFRDRESVNI
jgi:hypothetical protein